MSPKNTDAREFVTPLSASARHPPNFTDLLARPVVKAPLPQDFSREKEAAHLSELWTSNPGLRVYDYNRFVHAGGSGMTFECHADGDHRQVAMKIARKFLYDRSATATEQAGVLQPARNLSPVSDEELRALRTLAHPNVVSLVEAIAEQAKGVIAIATTYVKKPANLDDYLRSVLKRDPPQKRQVGDVLAPNRIDEACRFLHGRMLEIASALEHMHSKQMFHFDIKPANILISEAISSKPAVLTDMGCCIHASDHIKGTKIRAHFTYTYAHPDLLRQDKSMKSITGGGLKVSNTVEIDDHLHRYDLFALGRTIQECLAIFHLEFGDRCYASYPFRFMHLIAACLLDGNNVPSGDAHGFAHRDGRRFVGDTALGYPITFFSAARIETADELVQRLRRFDSSFAVGQLVPELASIQHAVINAGTDASAPFTARVAAMFNHPTLRRLAGEPQLGWMREVFPSAKQDRWTHTVGVFSAVCKYYAALFADPEIPTVRMLMDASDVEHALVAAILHDLGQSTFGHDFEEVDSELFRHEGFVRALLYEQTFAKQPLSEVVTTAWPGVDLRRVLGILSEPPAAQRERTQARSQVRARYVDGLARDAVDGPIDADKLDYTLRDSLACGVPYGSGVDANRLLKSLTVGHRDDGAGGTLALAYRSKGRAGVLSLLLARLQMFDAVYWHHSYRCIQSMVAHAAIMTFVDPQMRAEGLGKSLTRDELRSLYYEVVLLGRDWRDLKFPLLAHGARRFDLQDTEQRHVLPNKAETRRLQEIGAKLRASVPAGDIRGERALDFLWRLSGGGARRLIELAVTRSRFKRIYERRVEGTARKGEYWRIREALAPTARVKLSKALEELMIQAVRRAVQERAEGVTSRMRNALEERLGEVESRVEPLVVVDFPRRGIPKDKRIPTEIGDAVRKYFVARAPKEHQVSIFEMVEQLQMQQATLRVFVAPELHELVLRFVDSESIGAVVAETLP